jgi:hypothetical protein
LALIDCAWCSRCVSSSSPSSLCCCCVRVGHAFPGRTDHSSGFCCVIGHTRGEGHLLQRQSEAGEIPPSSITAPRSQLLVTCAS